MPLWVCPTLEYADHLLQVGQVALLGGQDEDVREALAIYRAALGARHLKTGKEFRANPVRRGGSQFPAATPTGREKPAR